MAAAALNFSLECTVTFAGESIPGFGPVGRTFTSNAPQLDIIDLYISGVDRWVAQRESYNHSEDVCLTSATECELYRQV